MSSLSPDSSPCVPPENPSGSMLVGLPRVPRPEPYADLVNVVLPPSWETLLSGIIKVHGTGPTGERLVEYSLSTDALSPPARQNLQDRLTLEQVNTASASWLRRVCEGTQDAWDITVLPSPIQGPTPAHRMELVIPPFAEYLMNPERLGTEYYSEVQVGDTRLRLDACIKLRYDSLELTLSRADPGSTSRLEVYQVKGSSAPNVALHERLSDLRTKAWRAMEALWDDGPTGFRQHLAITAWKSEPEVRLASGASITLRLDEAKPRITLASSGLTRQAKNTRSISMCSWSFASGLYPEDLHLRLIQTAQRLQQLASVSRSEAKIYDELALLSEASDLKAIRSRPASPEHVLGPALYERLSALPHISLSPVPILSRTQQVEILRGVRRVGISLETAGSLKFAPQILSRMELAFTPEGDVYVELANEMNNAIKARVSARSRFDRITDEDCVLTLSSLFDAQVGEHTPWESRVALLKTLSRLRLRDPAHNSLTHVGRGRLPNYTDEQTHRLIDTLAVPYISWLNRNSASPEITSYVSSLSPGHLQVVLSKPDYRFQLSLQFADSHLRQIDIRPQKLSNRNPEPHSLTSGTYGYLCDIPVADADPNGASITTLNELTRLFCAFSREIAQGSRGPFEDSELQQFLRRIAKPGDGVSRAY